MGLDGRGITIINANEQMRDYTYEILKFLYDNNGKVDVELLMTQLTKDTDTSKVQDEKQTIAYHIISSKDPENKFIEPIPLTLSSEFSNRYFNKGRQWLNDDVTIELQLRQEGVEEYRRLDKIHNPTPPIQPVTYIQTTHGQHSPIVGRDMAFGDNKSNDESAESKELAKEQLKDIPKNAKDRKQMVILTIILVCATIAGILLTVFLSK